MEKQYIITIVREFGSMGRPIARRLSELLGIEFYDRDIVEKTARKMNLPVSVISINEENQGSAYSRMRFPLGKSSREKQDEIFRVQSEIIRSLAKRESCVIVGRCSDYILRDFENRLSICVYAPFEKRIENCVSSLGMDEETAMQMTVEVDKARRKYHKRYANYSPEDIKNKNLLIDSSFFGIEGTAKLIAEIAKSKFGK
ncbi:MAG TPA: cytidylate kinase-like family protein [Candidatus Enterocloster excrementipullorum]|uniref:Cytidylate kinase-like family protein n=1 Tax=Candidatus Enterocloster excrementipullorum TaxID=2838559 RepID=A0A9D2SFS1_9FIRM|nr:cytidylate kinase-like family protein [Candidatus Enterocloster excrementipullorum]